MGQRQKQRKIACLRFWRMVQLRHLPRFENRSAGTWRLYNSCSQQGSLKKLGGWVKKNECFVADGCGGKEGKSTVLKKTASHSFRWQKPSTYENCGTCLQSFAPSVL